MAGLTKWSPESHRRPWQRRHSSVKQHGDEPEGEGEGRGDGVEHWLTTVTNAWSEKAEEDRSSGEVAAEPRPVREGADGGEDGGVDPWRPTTIPTA